MKVQNILSLINIAHGLSAVWINDEIDVAGFKHFDLSMRHVRCSRPNGN